MILPALGNEEEVAVVQPDSGIWRKCGPCKRPIPFGAPFFMCSVSTCKKNAFCSTACFHAHVPAMRHRDAWAEEETAPNRPEGSGLER